MSDVTRVIGIDFGTSTSVVCVKRYQGGEALGGAFLSSAVTFGNGQGDTRAFTVIRRNSDGTYTCGREAEEQDPGTEVFREFKMELENPDETKRAQAWALTEEFFKYLYRWYDHQRSNLGEAGDREKTLVSFPAKWSEDTRQFMAEAARKAGFPDVSVMDEPSAALYATLTQNMNDVSAKGLLRAGEPGYMLLIDMGAGTTDLAVCRYSVDAGASGIIRAEQIKNEIVSTWPESAGAPTFGGREVDRLLEGYLTDYMISCGLPENKARQLVRRANPVKSWKEKTVSARLNEGTPVDSCGFLAGYMMMLDVVPPFPAIDRGKFEGLLAEKLEDFKALVTGCLDRASEVEPAIAENGVDLVVLTGGHSVWYFTEALLNGTMPGVSHPALRRVQAEKSRVMRLSNPQETVALGLVYSLLPMKVEKSGGLQWPYVTNEELAGLANQYFRRDGRPARAAYITDWLEFINKDRDPGDSLDGLCQYLRRKVNFLWRYDDSARPKFPDVADEVYYALSNYYKTRYFLIEKFTMSGIYVNSVFYPWRKFCEANLGDDLSACLQAFLCTLLRRGDDDMEYWIDWLFWPDVSAEEYGECVKCIFSGSNPYEVTPLTEPTKAEIMEKWHMCPDQPVYAIAPKSAMDQHDGLVFCRDGLAMFDYPPTSWEEFLESEYSEGSILKTLQDGVKAMVNRDSWNDGALWPEITDEWIGHLARVYIRSNWNNTWLPTALELPGAMETLDTLRKQYSIREDERIFAIFPGPDDGTVYTERGFYMPSIACTWREVLDGTATNLEENMTKLRDCLRDQVGFCETAEESGSDDDAAGGRLAERADRFFWSWVNDPAHALRGWTVSCPVKFAIRWSYDQGREYTLSVSEEGLHIENMNRSSEQWRRDVSWEDFLSGTLRTIGFHVELQWNRRGDLCLASIADNAMLNHLLRFLAGLQKELCGKTSTNRQEDTDVSGKTYVWDDRLIPKAKAFIQSNRRPWPKLFPDPGKMQFFRMRLGIPMNAEIYLAHTSAILQSRLGRDGWAITDQGIYNRALWSDPEYLSWASFLNGTISKDSINITDPQGVKFALYLTLLEDNQRKEVLDLFNRLQAYLRKESLALQGGN